MADNSPKLRIHHWSWHREYGYLKAEGQVENVSGDSLDNVEAVVSYFDSSGNFITSDDALISYNPVLAGQTSPWETVTTDNPEAATARVEFKELMGGTIASEEVPDAPTKHRSRRRRRH